MLFEETNILDCYIVGCQRHFDDRGQFQELFEKEKYHILLKKYDILTNTRLIEPEWQQVNWSVSKKNVLRGIHIANYIKLVTCVSGCIWDFVVDFRKDSPTFLQHVGIELSANDSRQVFVPPGCGHGFVSLEENSSVVYLQTDRFISAGEITVKYSDPQLNINYPGENWIISQRDMNAMSVAEFISTYIKT